MVKSALDKFLDCEYHIVDGECIALDTFVADFHDWLAKTGRDKPEAWPRDQVRRQLPMATPVGYGPQNRLTIGNLSATLSRPRRYIRVGDKIRLESPA